MLTQSARLGDSKLAQLVLTFVHYEGSGLQITSMIHGVRHGIPFLALTIFAGPQYLPMPFAWTHFVIYTFHE